MNILFFKLIVFILKKNFFFYFNFKTKPLFFKIIFNKTLTLHIKNIKNNKESLEYKIHYLI